MVLIGNGDFICNGLSCENCETCKFDEDLFIPKNQSMKPICNYCEYLVKNFLGDDRRFFNACCSKNLVDCGSYVRPMTIEYHTFQMADIERPFWCPIKEKETSLTLPKKIEAVTVKTEEKKPFSSLTFSEKKEFIKTLTPITKWEDIKVDHYYVIPKLASTTKKIIRVETKTDNLIRCHEISEYSGTEYSTITTIHNDDAELNLIVELRNY